MATFDPAPDRVDEVIREVIQEYYPDLVEAQASIGSVFAYPATDKDGKPTGPAMVKNGRQVLARIKRNSEEDRAGGKADATITFDAAEWKRLDDEPDGIQQQRAMVDHELQHLIVRREGNSSTGVILTDDRGRPLFKLREHDWEVTGFRVVAERHGKHSYERQIAREFHDNFGNLLFDFASDQATLPGVEPEARPRRRGRAAAVAAANR